MTIENFTKLGLCKLVENENKIICKGCFSKIQEYVLKNIANKKDNVWTIDKDWRYFLQVYREVRHQEYHIDSFRVTSKIYAKKKDIVRLLQNQIFQDLKNSDDYALRELSDIKDSYEFKVSNDDDFMVLSFSHTEINYHNNWGISKHNWCGSCDLKQWSVLNSYENVLSYKKDTITPSHSYLFMDLTPIFLYKFLTADESLRIIKNAPKTTNNAL